MSRWVKAVSFALALLFLSTGGFGQALPAIKLDSLTAFMQLGPGQDHSGSFQITNTGDQPVSIEILLRDFILTEEGTFTQLAPGALGESSLADYITYSPDNVTLEPGESQIVHYYFSLPLEATGPHWATLIVGPEAPTEMTTHPEGEEGMALVVHFIFNYAFVIIQRELTPPEPAGQMTGLDVTGNTTDEGRESLTVRSTFQNLCGDVLRCQIYVEVRDAAGEEILRYDFPPGRVVLPNSQRVFSHTFEDVDMPPGQYLILCVTDFGGDHLVAAQYMATVEEAP